MRPATSMDSPAASPWRRPRRRLARWGASVIGVCLLLASAVTAAAEPLIARFRVAIDSPQPIALRGELSVTGGALERLQQLSLNPSAAAGSSLEDGKVRLHHRTATARDAFDVTANTTDGGAFELRLADNDAVVASIPLAEARNATPAAPLTVPFGQTGATITLSRLPADRMRLEAPRDSFIFEPAERFACDVVLEPDGLSPGDEFEFVATLSRGRTGAEVWRSEPTRVALNEAGVTRTSIDLTLPDAEGVYRLTLSAVKPAGFRSRFLPGSHLLHTADTPIAQRSVQLAVFDPQRRPLRPGDWRESFAFDPRAHGWADRLPERMRWRRLPWFASGPQSSEEGQDTPRNGAIEIAPSPGDGRVHWRAYPLSVDQPGGVYAVEVEALGAPGDLLTITVLEPDALGDLRPVSGVVTHVTPRWNRDAKPAPARLIVRPRTGSPLLVLGNPSETTAARFGRVRLLKSRGVEAAEPAKERIVALDWTDADLPHAVGASHVRSELGAFEQPDLVTLWETATAMADRVEASGANAASVPVNQAGGAIFTSRLWTSPRYDLGVWSEGAADTPRRELLRLIALEFDRRGLRLLPALRFDAPTAAIESRNGAYDADGDDAVVARRLAVEEMLSAIGRNEVIAGIGIRLTPENWALRQPPTEGADAQRLVSAYDELARAAARVIGRETPLLLLPSELATRPDIARGLTPRLGVSGGGAAEYATASGLTAIVEEASATRVAAPFGAASTDVRLSGVNTTVNLFAGLRKSLPANLGAEARSLRAGRFPLRLIGSDKRLRGSGGSATGEVLLPGLAVEPTAEPAMLASAINEGVKVVLLDSDATAGWLDEPAIQRRKLYAAAPTAPTAVRADTDASLDVTANAYDLPDGGAVALVTNQTAWARQARVTIQTPTRLRGAPIDANKPSNSLSTSSQWFDTGYHVIDFKLEPFQSAAWRFTTGGVKVDGVRVDPEPEALRELAEGLADLQSRDTTHRRPFERIVNPSFEQHELGADGALGLSGWRLGEGASIDQETAVDGAASIRLKATASQGATLSSEPFAAPTTGQLVLGLRVLPRELEPGSELRIDLEQVDGPYRNRASLTAQQLTRPQDGEATSPDWLPPIVFPMDDLPFGSSSPMRLRFTLVGQGELHIDDLRPEDLVLPLDGYGGIDMRTERFAIVRLLQTSQTMLDEGRLEACRELLDSYWARFLIENFPRRDAETAVAQEAPPADNQADTAETEEEAPSISERLRGYLPRWWR